MKKMNIIAVFDKSKENILMCKRTKDPYKGMYNFVGGKIEKENDSLREAYRELEEETNIKKEDINLIYFMNITYVKWERDLEIYYGVLNKEVELIEDFFNTKKYAGEGNIGHIIEEIKIDWEKYS